MGNEIPSLLMENSLKSHMKLNPAYVFQHVFIIFLRMHTYF